LCEFWKWHRFPAPPLEILPDYGRNGIMVEYKGVNVCAAFIYATSSPVLFHLEWIVSNPKIKDRETRRLALITLIDSSCGFIKNAGGKVVYTSLKNESLVNHYKECGWVEGSTGCIEMVKNLEVYKN
jgi:hypothetical protein